MAKKKALKSEKNQATKRNLIDKANSAVVTITSIAAFVVVFCLVAGKSLTSQAGYQSRVITAEKATIKQLDENLANVKSLQTSYQTFAESEDNLIGGLASGDGEKDGSNPAIILDALPSSYDFPALANSLEALTKKSGVTINSISGSDDEIAQSENTSSDSPEPIDMPFQLSVTGGYGEVKKLVDILEKSIRPIQVQSVQISGDQDKLTLNISGKTYYQPAKTLNLKMKVVK